MSSSPRPDAARTETSVGRKLRRPLTLRSKLIVGMLALIIAVCGVVAVSTEFFLSRYLVMQVDNQVRQLNTFAKGPDRQRGGEVFLPNNVLDCGDNPGRFGPGQGLGGLSALIIDGQVVSSGILTPTARNSVQCTALPTSSDSTLTALPTDGSVQTVTIDGFGDYRAAAGVLSDGTVVVSGLPLDTVRASLVQLGIILAIVTGVAVLLGVVVVFWIVRRSLRPLDEVVATARQVSTLTLDRGEVDLGVRVPDRDTDTRTEVGQVGAALNQMLGHVSHALMARQESETRVRQFVADASHELRTPLAAIRGYAELAGREEHDAEGVAHALRRVESESARMTTLVDDLLLLARLDAGRPLSKEEVDLTLVVVDAVSDARVAGPDHRWQLDLPEEPVMTIGDPARLHQVLVNLLANARTHTPAGTTVWCRLRTESGASVMTVTDDGPGVPPALQPEIFNRFVRGDSSRSRAAGSTGLGLAIVAAVVAAHRGTVSLSSRPGRTTFTVRLPRSDGPPAVPQSNEVIRSGESAELGDGHPSRSLTSGS